MKSHIIQAFTGAGRDVLAQEMGEPVEPGKMKMQGGPYKTNDVTVVIGLAGDMEGSVILSMSKDTALAYVSRVMGEPTAELDELAQSGVGELANVIAGRAGAILGEKGDDVVIAPPTIILGAGSILSTLGLPRLILPVETPLGVVQIQLATNGKG